MMRDKVIDLLRPEANTDVKLSVISLFMAKMMEMYDDRIVELERRQLQKGDQGERGEQGKQGKDGKDGRDGKDGANGIGRDGKDGKAGAKGKDGVSVINADIAADGHLVLKLSNGSIIDAGELPMSDDYKTVLQTIMNKPQITVSATAPPNPQPNDLWYDIS